MIYRLTKEFQIQTEEQKDKRVNQFCSSVLLSKILIYLIHICQNEIHKLSEESMHAISKEHACYSEKGRTLSKRQFKLNLQIINFQLIDNQYRIILNVNLAG